MALTRKALKAMGLTDEQVDSIVEMHAETVDALKERLRAADEKSGDYDALKKELDDLKGGKDWKSEYNNIKKEYEDYKKGVSEKETAAAKRKAVKEYFEGKGITGQNLDIAMRGASEEIAAIELADGKIKDAGALDALINGTYKGLVVSTSTKGADTVNPPANSGSKKTREEILAIKDVGERQRAIAQNLELFGYSPNGKE